jgi:hypothetical protein
MYHRRPDEWQPGCQRRRFRRRRRSWLRQMAADCCLLLTLQLAEDFFPSEALRAGDLRVLKEAEKMMMGAQLTLQRHRGGWGGCPDRVVVSDQGAAPVLASRRCWACDVSLQQACMIAIGGRASVTTWKSNSGRSCDGGAKPAETSSRAVASGGEMVAMALITSVGNSNSRTPMASGC